jgi:carbon storage regulator
MLVLSRRSGEEVIIASNIRVIVLAIRGRNVQLGFSAPADAAIVRSELISLAVRPTEQASKPILGLAEVVRRQGPEKRRRLGFRLHRRPKDGS